MIKKINILFKKKFKYNQLQSIVPPGQSGTNNSGNVNANNPTPSTSYSSAAMASMTAQQQQQSHSKLSQQPPMPMPSAADISLLLSLGMGGLDASQLANLDLQKLAMYLVSIFNHPLHKKKKNNTKKFSSLPRFFFPLLDVSKFFEIF